MPSLRGIAPDGPAALPPGGRAPVDGFDAAVRQEAMKLAEYVRPEALDESQRLWRATGKVPLANRCSCFATSPQR